MSNTFTPTIQADIAATLKWVKVPGCTIYDYDLGRRVITGRGIYFDVLTLMNHIQPAK